MCNLMRFIFTSACYFWTKKSAFVLAVSPMMHLSISIFTDWVCRKGGYWSGLMYPNCRVAQREQTVCILSLPGWFLCRLAPVSPCFEMQKGHLSVLCSFASVWRMSLCICVCWLRPFTAKPPFVTGERRAVERARERGRVVDAQYRRRRRGKRWKEASRKGELRHKVGSISFSYFLVWIEQWVRGNPKPCDWYLTSGGRGTARRVRTSSETLLPSAKIWLVGGAYSGPALRLHTKRGTSSSCAWISEMP